MQHHIKPAHDPKTELLRFVPKDSLADQSARPSPKQCHQVKRVLGHSPAIDLSTAFVESVGNKCDETQDDDNGQVDEREVFHGQSQPASQ